MPVVKMEATFDDPAMGSCGYRVVVDTEVPPEAGPWDSQRNIEQVFESWIERIVGNMENFSFEFFCDGERVVDDTKVS